MTYYPLDFSKVVHDDQYLCDHDAKPGVFVRTINGNDNCLKLKPGDYFNPGLHVVIQHSHPKYSEISKLTFNDATDLFTHLIWDIEFYRSISSSLALTEFNVQAKTILTHAVACDTGLLREVEKQLKKLRN